MEFLIFGLPIVALIWLISAIIQFCRTNKENIICSIIIVAWIVIIGGFLFSIIYSISVYGM